MSGGEAVWGTLDGLDNEPEGGGKGYPCSRPPGHQGRHLYAEEPTNYAPGWNRDLIDNYPEYSLVRLSAEPAEPRGSGLSDPRANTMLSSPPTSRMRRCLLTASLPDAMNRRVIYGVALGDLHGLERRGMVTNVARDYHGYRADLTEHGWAWVHAYERAGGQAPTPQQR